MTHLTDIREIALEAAAIAMGSASLDAGSLSMRDRRTLAEHAYQAVVTILAREIRAEGDRIADTARTVHGFTHAEGLRAAAVFALSTSAGETKTSNEEDQP